MSVELVMPSNHLILCHPFMLNESDKSGHHYLVPDLREKASRFSALSIMLAVSLSHMAFIILRHFSSISSLLTVGIINVYQIFSHAYSVFFKKIYLLFLAVLGLHCCTQSFSSCGEQELLFIVMCGLLVAVASLTAEHGL